MFPEWHHAVPESETLKTFRMYPQPIAPSNPTIVSKLILYGRLNSRYFTRDVRFNFLVWHFGWELSEK